MSKKTKATNLIADNLENEFKLALSDELRKVPKAYQMINQYDSSTEVQTFDGDLNTNFALVVPIGVTVDERKYRINGMKKVVDILDDLNSKEFIKSMLSPLSGILLPSGKYVVVSYPALTENGQEYLNNTYPEFKLDEEINAISEK